MNKILDFLFPELSVIPRDDDRPHIRPLYWWQYFIPSERKKFVMMDAMLGADWENGGKEKMEKALEEVMFYGETLKENEKEK